MTAVLGGSLGFVGLDGNLDISVTTQIRLQRQLAITYPMPHLKRTPRIELTISYRFDDHCIMMSTANKTITQKGIKKSPCKFKPPSTHFTLNHQTRIASHINNVRHHPIRRTQMQTRASDHRVLQEDPTGTRQMQGELRGWGESHAAACMYRIAGLGDFRVA